METGLELVTVAGGVPAGLRRWLLSGWLRAGVRCLYDLGGNSAGKRAQVLTFSPSFPLSLSPFALFLSGCPRVLLLALSVRSGRAGWRHRGGGRRRVHLAGVLCVSCSPAGRVGAVRAGAGAGAGHGRRSQANRLTNRQNAQRFNNKCSIMTKIMLCILYFLRCKYACFGVKMAVFLTFWI